MDVPAMAQRVAGAANVPVEQRYRLDAVKVHGAVFFLRIACDSCK